MDKNFTENKKSQRISTTWIAVMAMHSALIFLCIQYFRIPMGEQFVHFGNALVVLGVLVFGFSRGTLSGAMGLFLFDLLNGYVATSWIYTLECVAISALAYFLFEKVFKKNDKIHIITTIAVSTSILKIITNMIRYTFFKGMFVMQLGLNESLIYALTKITGTFGSAIFTAITVPLLYPIYKRIAKNIKF